MDEIVFIGRHGDWACSRRLEIGEETPLSAVALELSEVREEASRKAFALLSLGEAALGARAGELASGGTGYAAASRALSAAKPGALKALFVSSVPEARLAPFAQAFFVNAFLSAERIPFKASPALVSSAPKPTAAAKAAAREAGEECVVFAAKAGDWVSIKKMSIDSATKPVEVAAMLAGVRDTAERKAFAFAGVDAEKIGAAAEQIAKGKRKGFAGLALAFAEMAGGKAEKTAAGAASSPQAAPLAEAMLVSRVLSALGMDAEVGIEALKKAFPELKIPMPKGRRAGAKKKK
jgi:hypothetical protein